MSVVATAIQPVVPVTAQQNVLNSIANQYPVAQQAFQRCRFTGGQLQISQVKGTTIGKADNIQTVRLVIQAIEPVGNADTARAADSKEQVIAVLADADIARANALAKLQGICAGITTGFNNGVVAAAQLVQVGIITQPTVEDVITGAAVDKSSPSPPSIRSLPPLLAERHHCHH